MNDRPPILNINPADPFNPKPIIVQLRFDEPKEVEGKFGPQFLYSVKYNNKDHTIFASKALDAAIYETGAKANDHVAIIRTGEGKDTRWTARLVDVDGVPIEGSPRKILDAPPAARATPSSAPAVVKPQVSPEDRVAAFLMDESLYWGAFRRATRALDGQNFNVDANAIAFVLYKMAKEHGVELGMDGDPVLVTPADMPF